VHGDCDLELQEVRKVVGACGIIVASVSVGTSIADVVLQISGGADADMHTWYMKN
jgi:hypothetical protein